MEEKKEETKEEKEEKKNLIYWTRVKPLFLGTYEAKQTKLNVAGAAVDPIITFLEEKIKEGVEEVIKAMPRKTKGEHKDELIRKTIKASDVRKAKTAHTKMIKDATKVAKPKKAPVKKKAKKRRR